MDMATVYQEEFGVKCRDDCLKFAAVQSSLETELGMNWDEVENVINLIVTKIIFASKWFHKNNRNSEIFFEYQGSV